MNEINQESDVKVPISLNILEQMLKQKNRSNWFSFGAGAAAMLVPFGIYFDRLPQTGFAGILAVVFIFMARR